MAHIDFGSKIPTRPVCIIVLGATVQLWAVRSSWFSVAWKPPATLSICGILDLRAKFHSDAQAYKRDTELSA